MSLSVARLREGLAAMHLDHTQAQLRQMQEFAALLQHWNRTTSLMAKSQMQRLLSAHILDSLALLPHLRGPQVVDIGSGGGFPGIPLAIMRPDLRFTLLDANGRKVRFLSQVRRSLDLPHITPLHARAERPPPTAPADCAVTRALADIELQLRYCRGWLSDRGVLLALKGPKPEPVPAPYRHERIELEIPGLNARRFLYRVEMQR